MIALIQTFRVFRGLVERLERLPTFWRLSFSWRIYGIVYVVPFGTVPDFFTASKMRRLQCSELDRLKVRVLALRLLWWRLRCTLDFVA